MDKSSLEQQIFGSILIPFVVRKGEPILITLLLPCLAGGRGGGNQNTGAYQFFLQNKFELFILLFHLILALCDYSVTNAFQLTFLKCIS